MLASILLLTGCGNLASYLDPYQKPYTWRPTDAPTANLAAQLVNPRDLVSGRGSAEGDSKESEQAIERVWQDRPKPIATSSGTSGGGATGTAGAAGGAAGSPGGAN